MNAQTQTALTNFIALAQNLVDEHHTRCFPMLPRVVLSMDKGRRYARIMRGEGENGEQGRSVYCFIDLTNGDVLKAATWKAPAKHARGSIFAENPIAGVNPYGANYLV